MIAYVLITTDVGFTSEILQAMNTIPNVLEIHAVYGEYDIVMKVETESLSTLSQTVFGKIRRLDNVNSTLTLIVVEDSDPSLIEDDPSYSK